MELRTCNWVMDLSWMLKNHTSLTSQPSARFILAYMMPVTSKWWRQRLDVSLLLTTFWTPLSLFGLSSDISFFSLRQLWLIHCHYRTPIQQSYYSACVLLLWVFLAALKAAGFHWTHYLILVCYGLCNPINLNAWEECHHLRKGQFIQIYCLILMGSHLLI
jgi:hypothetical protein